MALSCGDDHSVGFHQRTMRYWNNGRMESKRLRLSLRTDKVKA